MRHIGNLKAAKQPMPHPDVPKLVDLYKTISSLAAHADIGTFLHRIDIQGEANHPELVLKYFQMTFDGPRRTIYGLNLLRIFVMTLELFATFLVGQQECLSLLWREHLHRLGARLQVRFEKAKQELDDQDGA